MKDIKKLVLLNREVKSLGEVLLFYKKTQNPIKCFDRYEDLVRNKEDIERKIEIYNENKDKAKDDKSEILRLITLKFKMKLIDLT